MPMSKESPIMPGTAALTEDDVFVFYPNNLTLTLKKNIIRF